ncbi:MAG: response regulator [Gammaproteobacteria bacterium]
MDAAATTILLVDDNAAHRYSTRRFLAAAGFAVREAATGQDALVEARRKPDLIVLDVNLPDIDGFEVCRTIRGNPDTARIPVVHLSATFVGSADYVHGLDAGADGYLTHPVEPAVLVATINAFLRTRAVEEELRRSEERFRDIFRQVISGIAVLDDAHAIVEANPAMCRMLDQSREQLIGRRLEEFLLPRPDAPGTAARGVIGESGSVELVRADGERTVLEWKLLGSDGSASRMLIASDITARRALELERERFLASERLARADAEKANRLKDHFLATVSHELRSPLNAIVGWAHVLQLRSAQYPDEVRKGVEAIERNAKLQSQLINDLLDISRATSGKLFLERAPMRLLPAVQAACADAQAAADAKRIAIVMRGDSGNPLVIGDALRLQQVIGNLLNNAIKFTEPGGRVAVELTQPDARTACVKIIDRGRGISPEFLPHIFDTFRQEESAPNRAHEGMGLGLAIVRKLVDMHGGTVEVHSAGLNQGATFTVCLPICPDDLGRDAADASMMAAATYGLTGLRVLYVDDDADARDMVRRLLEERHAEVRVAGSAAEALVLIAQATPDLLISDIGMPKQDGYDLIRQIRSGPAPQSRLRAIALTAFGQSSDRERALASGYDAHLTKPIDPDELFRTIAKVNGAERGVSSAG